MHEIFLRMAPLIFGALCVALPEVGDLVIALAAAFALWAAVSTSYRELRLRVAAAMLWGVLFALAVLLLSDRFDLRYVWIYSGAELPIYLKLANLWGGDEGTSLLLAACCTSLAARGVGDQILRIDANSAISAALALIAVWLSPFAATPADWLANAASQGMNAHLMKIWMVFHAPLVIAAYAWTLSLVGPSLAALGGDVALWPGRANVRARRAWALLTAGIGFGMVWAFEDAMYGQIWHWDPVQTSVFSVWCFLTAHLHGITGWRSGRRMWQWTPAFSLISAALTVVALAVTRNDVLASSHRYVGSSSWRLYVALAGALFIAGVVMWWRGQRQVAALAPPVPSRSSALVLRATQLLFLSMGLWAIGQLAWAFIASAQQMPRPDDLKPFYATLTNWARGSELPLLRLAFAQWDVDGYSLARVLPYPIIAIGLIGGWFFFSRLATRLGWGTLVLAASFCAAAFFRGGLVAHQYTGGGVLSQHVVNLLPLLDAGLVAGAYLALACLTWSVRGALQRPFLSGYFLSLGLIHLGAIVALWGAFLSTALNGYSQHLVKVASDWQREHRGYEFRVSALNVDRAPDGGRFGGGDGFRALASLDIQTPDGRSLSGKTLYRDARSAINGYSGPVRQICEILDYRYARYANQPGYVLHPFIDHGLLQDLQVWVSTSGAVAALEGGGQSPQIVVVLRFFPFASFLWFGLVMTSVGAFLIALRRRKDLA